MVVNGLRVALLLVLGFATPLLAADTLISAARLLDVRSGKLLDRPVLLVRDGSSKSRATAPGPRRPRMPPRSVWMA